MRRSQKLQVPSDDDDGDDDDVLSEAGRPTGITVPSVLWNRCLGTTEGGGSEGEVGILGLGAHSSMSLSISLTSFVQYSKVFLNWCPSSKQSSYCAAIQQAA